MFEAVIGSGRLINNMRVAAEREAACINQADSWGSEGPAGVLTMSNRPRLHLSFSRLIQPNHSGIVRWRKVGSIVKEIDFTSRKDETNKNVSSVHWSRYLNLIWLSNYICNIIKYFIPFYELIWLDVRAVPQCCNNKKFNNNYLVNSPYYED